MPLQRLDTAPDNHTIVRSTIDLAHNLGLTAIAAEDVENHPTWNQLVRLGCDTAQQGYYHSRPQPAHTLSPDDTADTPPRHHRDSRPEHHGRPSAPNPATATSTAR